MKVEIKLEDSTVLTLPITEEYLIKNSDKTIVEICQEAVAEMIEMRRQTMAL